MSDDPFAQVRPYMQRLVRTLVQFNRPLLAQVLDADKPPTWLVECMVDASIINRARARGVAAGAVFRTLTDDEFRQRVFELFKRLLRKELEIATRRGAGK
jgi:hypothetical protein